jgi:phosphoglycolate phosphatase-like HAD superfamily hydrolase
MSGATERTSTVATIAGPASVPAKVAARTIGRLLLAVAVAAGSLGTPAAQAEDGAPLASWNDTAARRRILAFVEDVTKPGSDGFVPAAERVAVFDNDGTLWSERPLYFQLLYAIDYVKANVGKHPEWRARQPFRAVLEHDHGALAAAGEQGVAELVMASHAGMTTDEFDASVRSWLKTARHPEKGRLYTQLVFQPMLELLQHLRDHGFSTWIVSGGGVEFVRGFAEEVYGIPPQQVVGSSIDMAFELRDGRPVLVRQAKLAFIDDGPGKPVGIQRHIGRRPIAAFGNSDGDLEMLQWTAAGDGPRLVALVRHTDAEREWAYDRDSPVGRLDAALRQANANGWLVVDMKRDWKRVHPAETADR